jgi:predicted nucleotidyltransferase
MSANAWDWIGRLPPELGGQRTILRRLLRVCEKDPDIRWLAIGCSLARDAADRLSDLDLAVGLADDRFDAALPRLRQVVDGLADLVESLHHQLPAVRSAHERIFAQYADRCQVDLVAFLASEPIGSVPDVVVLYDPGGLMASAAERPAVTQEVTPDVTPDQVREWAFTGWCALADLGKYLRRGSRWEAHARLHEARAQLWQLWAVSQGVPSPQYGLTSVLDFAPGQLPDGIDTTASDLDPARLLAAGRNLARLLTDVGTGLPSGHQAALPQAMARFVQADLAGVRLPGR